MDLGRTQSEEFYPLHRVYLIASTVQWLANLGLLFTETNSMDRDLSAESPSS